MQNINKVLGSLGSELGREIVAEAHPGNRDSPYSIRISDLNPTQSFSLVLSRSWRTTRITLEVDPFSEEVVHHLCSKMYKNSDTIFAMIEGNESAYSEITLKIDGSPFFGKIENLSDEPSLIFEVDVLTFESSLEEGQLNDKEEALCVFALTLIVSVVPAIERDFRNPDEVLGYPEGAVASVVVNKYERDPKNRKNAIAIHGVNCLACGFNFQEEYGTLGEGYIVVHHLTPVSKMTPNYVVDPKNDLVTLCANCHAMVHRQDPPMSLTELRNLLLS